MSEYYEDELGQIDKQLEVRFQSQYDKVALRFTVSVIRSGLYEIHPVLVDLLSILGSSNGDHEGVADLARKYPRFESALRVLQEIVYATPHNARVKNLKSDGNIITFEIGA